MGRQAKRSKLTVTVIKRNEVLDDQRKKKKTFKQKIKKTAILFHKEKPFIK